MAKEKFPTRIQQMIKSGWEREETAADLADRINKSATAKKLGVNYTTRQIAASMAWHTMRHNRS